MGTRSLLRTKHADAGPIAEPEVETEQTNCPQCGRDDYEVVIVGVDQYSATGTEYRVVKCRSCWLAYTNPRPTREAIGQCYPADYGCHKPREAIKRGRRERLNHFFETATLRTLYGYPPQPVGPLTSMLGRIGNWYLKVARRRAQWIEYRGEGRLLDFGCGAGIFLERMRHRGWNVEGVEVSADVARDVEKRTGIRVHAGSLPNAGLRQRQFDVVTMWQSLEHVHNPREVVRAARELVAPQGQLLVAVPNMASWSFEQFRKDWFALDVPRHLNHFTPHSLTQMLENEGFRVLRVQHVGSDGWIRHSSRASRESKCANWPAKLCVWKPIAVQIARWTQRRERADVILAWAEPV